MLRRIVGHVAGWNFKDRKTVQLSLDADGFGVLDVGLEVPGAVSASHYSLGFRIPLVDRYSKEQCFLDRNSAELEIRRGVLDHRLQATLFVKLPVVQRLLCANAPLAPADLAI